MYQNNIIKLISLVNCGLTNESCSCIAGFLKLNQSLEFLNLSYNQLDDEGAALLLNSIISIKNNLKGVNLENNKLSTQMLNNFKAYF